MTREEIIQKIQKVEALYQGTDSAGEMQAARGALDRLKGQLAAVPAPPVEYQFSMPDPWKRQLFMALARRHGLKPYRYRRQHRTTVMLRVSPSQLDTILWPQFVQLSDMLHEYLDESTRDIITRGVHGDISDADEQAGLPERA